MLIHNTNKSKTIPQQSGRKSKKDSIKKKRAYDGHCPTAPIILLAIPTHKNDRNTQNIFIAVSNL